MKIPVFQSPLKFPGWGQGGPFCSVLHVLSTKLLFPAYRMVWPQNSTTKLLSPAYKMVWHKLDPTKWYSFVNYTGPFFFNNNFLIFSSKNGQTVAFILQEKLQGHFVELPPCPDLSSKGNFSIAILQGVFPVTCSFSISPKMDKKCFSIFARGQTVHLFANNMLTFQKQIETKEW